MANARTHYEQLLAPIYVWMAGGVESALAAGAQDVAPLTPGDGLAIDLGAGFGMHAPDRSCFRFTTRSVPVSFRWSTCC